MLVSAASGARALALLLLTQKTVSKQRLGFAAGGQRAQNRGSRVNERVALGKIRKKLGGNRVAKLGIGENTRSVVKVKNSGE